MATDSQDDDWARHRYYLRACGPSLAVGQAEPRRATATGKVISNYVTSNERPEASADARDDALWAIKRLRPFLVDKHGHRRRICFPNERTGKPACQDYEDRVLDLHGAGYTPHEIKLIIHRWRIARPTARAIASCLMRNGLQPHKKRVQAATECT